MAIVGSREYPNLSMVKAYIDKLPPDTVVVSGAARGVDRAATYWAKLRGLEVEEYPAEWEKYGRSAGYRRNRIVVEVADQVVAFWDGKSKGTKHTIDLAGELGKPVEIHLPHTPLEQEE